MGNVAYHAVISDETSKLVSLVFVYHSWFKRYKQKHVFTTRFIMQGEVKTDLT